MYLYIKCTFTFTFVIKVFKYYWKWFTKYNPFLFRDIIYSFFTRKSYPLGLLNLLKRIFHLNRCVVGKWKSSLSLSSIHQVCPRGSAETGRRNVVKQTHNTDELAVNVIIRGSIGAHPSNDPFKHLTTLNHREPLQFFPWHRQRPHSPSQRDSFVCFWLS